MTSQIPWYLPAILGLTFGVLVWAIGCAMARRRREADPLADQSGCRKCPNCQLVVYSSCDKDHHGHTWCRCPRFPD